MTDAPKRGAMTPARRRRIWEAHNGLCEDCGEPVALDVADFDHRIAWWISHDDSDANLRPLHRDGCPGSHKVKTKADKGVIAHIKRIIAREEGTRRPREAIPSKGFPKPTTKTRWPKRAFGKQKLKEAQHDD